MGSSPINAVLGNSNSGAAFDSQILQSGEASIANDLQSGEDQLQLSQDSDNVKTALQLAGQLEKDRASEAQSIIGDMT
jgi:hypothetical protein